MELSKVRKQVLLATGHKWYKDNVLCHAWFEVVSHQLAAESKKKINHLATIIISYHQKTARLIPQGGVEF